jgi:hypothetical protein
MLSILSSIMLRFLHLVIETAETIAFTRRLALDISGDNASRGY